MKVFYVETTGSMYTCQAREDVIKLFHSRECGYWASEYRGKLAASLHDTGDGVTITIGKTKVSYDYSELMELKHILNEYTRIQEWPRGTKRRTRR